MINVAFIGTNGEIKQWCSPGDDDMYTDGQTYNNLIAKHFDAAVNLTEYSKTNIWNGSSWVVREWKPNNFYTWSGSNWSFRESDFLAEVRNKREGRLYSSDWTQVADSPLSDEKKVEWRTYRQQLRDLMANLPSDLDDLDDVSWPTKPS